MSNQKASPSALEWLKVARKDWTGIYSMLEKDDAEGAGSFLRQSLEKYFKAFLLQNGWKFQETHELGKLLGETVKYNPELESYRDLCERVSRYRSADQHSHLNTLALTHEDIKRDLKQSENLIKTLFSKKN